MRLIAPFTFIAFFLSGISALIYELTWVRSLKHVFGSDSLALSSMLTVFIGGIALGTFIAGKLIEHYFRFDNDLDDQSQQSLNLGQGYSLMFSYCTVELLLGLYALLVPFLLGPMVLGNIWSVFAAYALDNVIAGSLLKFLISSLFLLVPTMLMGISFPILTELLAIHNGKNFTAHHTDQFAAANLYATNTLGAIVGAIVGGFYLLPHVGLNNSAYLAAIINIFIGIFCSLWFLINHQSFRGANPLKVLSFINTAAEKLNSVIIKTKLAHIKLNDDEKKYHKTITTLLIISFTIGFINLSLEVIWTKILTLVIGSSTYSLSIILIAVLLGISAGAYLLNWILHIANFLKISYVKFLKISLFSFAVLIFISSSLFNQLPCLFLQLSQLMGNMDLLKFCLVAIIALPATLVEGVIFAFILYLISSDTNLIEAKLIEPVGTRVARASYINTIGAIVGSFITGFIFIPLLGSFGSGAYYSLQILITLSFLLALVPYRLADEKIPEPEAKHSKLYGDKPLKVQPIITNKTRSSNFSFNIALVLIVMSCAVFSLPQLNSQEISSGVSVYKYKHSNAEKILFNKEGFNSIVTVVENESANAIFLKNNGKIEAGKPIRDEDPSKADMLTQVLLGQLPVMIKPEARTALLIGMGSGISLKSLAKAGSKVKLNKIDVCEIEEQVFKAAEKFFNAPTGPNYKGVDLKRHVIDARNFLQALNSSSEVIANYDLIISQPSDPWISSALFTQEFWQLASNNLSEAGIFAQWLQLYSIDPEYLKIALGTFQSVFPEVLVFRPRDAAELIIIGSKSKIKINSTLIKELSYQKDLRKELTAIGINDEADLLSNLILVPESVRALLNATSLPSKNNKTLKYISQIDTESTEYQPKLTAIKDDSSVLKTNKINYSLNTDDNMLLEFHTSQKINEFYETLKKNDDFLMTKIDSQSLIRFLAEQEDPNLLLKIARSHNQINNKLHQKLALDLATELYNINQTPASTLTLYEVYKNKGELEKAESMLYDAQSKFSDIISSDRKSKVTIFEGLIEGSRLDDFQLASLAEIYKHASQWTKAEALVEKALELNPYSSNLFVTQGDIWLKELQSEATPVKLSHKAQAKLEGNLQAKLADIQLAYENAIEKDIFNSEAYSQLARFYLYKANAITDNGSEATTDIANFTSTAINNLSKALKINPHNAETQLALAEIYIDMLPDSQLAFAKAPTITIDKAIRYLANSVQLNPNSLEANYQMAELQYKIGNIDLAYKHSERLMKLCASGTRCVNELGTEKLEKANQLSDKLRKIAKGQELQKIN